MSHTDASKMADDPDNTMDPPLETAELLRAVLLEAEAGRLTASAGMIQRLEGVVITLECLGARRAQ